MKFGRPTADDFFKVAGGLAAINHTIGSAKDRAYKEEEREKVRGLSKDYGTVRKTMEAFPEVAPENISFGGLQVPESEAQVRDSALAGMASSMKSREYMAGADDRKLAGEVARQQNQFSMAKNKARNMFAGKAPAEIERTDWSQFGDDAYAYMLGAGEVVGEESRRSGNRTNLLKNAAAQGAAEFDRLTPVLQTAGDHLKSGDKQEAAKALASVVTDSYQPYRVHGVDGNGNITLTMFKDGQSTGQETITPEELYDRVSRISKTQYAREYAIWNQGIRDNNFEAAKKPIPLVKDGKVFMVAQHFNGRGQSQPFIMTNDPGLRAEFEGKSLQEIYQAGAMPYDKKGAGKAPTQKEINAKIAASVEQLAASAMSADEGAKTVRVPGVSFDGEAMTGTVTKEAKAALDGLAAQRGLVVQYAPEKIDVPWSLKEMDGYRIVHVGPAQGLRTAQPQQQGRQGGGAGGVDFSALEGKHLGGESEPRKKYANKNAEKSAEKHASISPEFEQRIAEITGLPGAGTGGLRAGVAVTPEFERRMLEMMRNGVPTKGVDLTNK